MAAYGAMRGAQGQRSVPYADTPGKAAQLPCGQNLGDWGCPGCGNMNWAVRQACNRCKAPMGSATAMDAPSEKPAYGEQPVGSNPGDWKCGSCGNTNFAVRQACNRCKAPQQPHGNFGEQPVGNNPGDWSCFSCGNMNFAIRQSCNRCKMPNQHADSLQQVSIPAGPAAPRGENPVGDNPGDWTGASCSNVNFAMRQACNRCKTPKPPQRGDKPAGQNQGDWACGGCGNLNFAIRQACNRCKARQPSAFAQPSPRTFGMQAPGPAAFGNQPAGHNQGDWRCDSCGNSNFAIRQACNRCKNPRPAQPAQYSQVQFAQPAQYGQQPAGQNAGDWTCGSCGNMNFAIRQACNRCKMPNTQGALAAPGARAQFGTAPAGRNAGDWICSSCSNNNFAIRQECNRCKNPRPASGGTITGGDWICPGCNNLNFPHREVCNKCSIPKSARIGSRGLHDGDWFCLKCGNHNYADKAACNKCAEPMGLDVTPYVGKPDPRSGGAIKEGDWICTACANHNFAAREECNKCKMPKPSLSNLEYQVADT